MWKRSYSLFAILLAATLGVLLWQLVRPHKVEPVFKGKPVSFWVKSLGDGSMDSHQLERTWATFGTDAVPYLTNALVQRSGRMGRGYMRLWPHLPSVIRKHLPRPVNGLSVRQHAVNILGFWREGGKLAIPALVGALKDEDWSVRQNAAGALGSVGREKPEVVIPALISVLRDEHPNVRGNAATSLGNLGSAAQAAVPELLKLLQDTNSYVSGTVGDGAAKMLLKIDPEAADRAGVK